MNSRGKADTSYLTLMSLLFALSVALTAAEYMIPPIPMMPPGVKLGLSNIVTMYCLFYLGKKSAFTIAILKSCFVFLIRGFTAFLLSLSGGILSTVVMLLLIVLVKANLSYLILSIAGAITHNIGQIVVASLLLGTDLVIAYLPLLLISGVVMGNVTGTLLKIILPALKRVSRIEPYISRRQSRSNKRNFQNTEVRSQ